MRREGDVAKAIGLADACELLAYAFDFPDERLARGLREGSFATDAEACLRDAGAAEEAVRRAVDGLALWRSDDEDDIGNASDLCALMRKAYSRLYLEPGGCTPVFPYESAFLHVERKLPGVPVLFRSPVTLDVERTMREAGVEAKRGRTVPCDSVSEEFEFLSYLFAKRADALVRAASDEADDWGGRACLFAHDHALAWLPQFMRRTSELSDDDPYAALAAFGSAVLEAIA